MGLTRTMEIIRLATWIDAPVERCFLLSLSMDLHAATLRPARERGGIRANRLIAEGETVVLEGRPFGIGHTSRIDVLRPHSYFRDVMVAGAFRHYVHEHHFAPMDDGTRMRDEIRFSTGWGPVARILARKRIKAFLKERNALIKRVAQSEEWRRYLEEGAANQVPPPIKASSARWQGTSLLQGARRIVVPPRPHA
jgi:ligand-binding SRPBCC domain-containing protein